MKCWPSLIRLWNMIFSFGTNTTALTSRKGTVRLEQHTFREVDDIIFYITFTDGMNTLCIFSSLLQNGVNSLNVEFVYIIKSMIDSSYPIDNINSMLMFGVGKQYSINFMFHGTPVDNKDYNENQKKICFAYLLR